MPYAQNQFMQNPYHHPYPYFYPPPYYPGHQRYEPIGRNSKQNYP